MPWKAKRQYLLTIQASRYCLLDLESSTKWAWRHHPVHISPSPDLRDSVFPFFALRRSCLTWRPSGVGRLSVFVCGAGFKWPVWAMKWGSDTLVCERAARCIIINQHGAGRPFILVKREKRHHCKQIWGIAASPSPKSDRGKFRYHLAKLTNCPVCQSD